MVKTALKILLWIVGILGGLVIALLIVLLILIWIASGNTPEGGTKIAKKGFVEIGGIKQGYFIRGEDENNPVLLFLHGGPGSPLLPLIKSTEIEKDFTVCYWDQRSAGMSYSSDIDPATMTADQMVEDTRQITDSLRKWYGVDKIYLMGHSWGTYLGIKTVEKYPELYRAYIGISQMSNQAESERLAYDYILDVATKANDTITVNSFRKYDKLAEDFPEDDYIVDVRFVALNKYGVGLKHKVGSPSDGSVFRYKGYTIGEKLRYMRGMMFHVLPLFQSSVRDNLMESATTFEVPVYFLHGKYDYQVSYKLAKDYLDTINAPVKEFVTFEQSAHSPNLEEPTKLAEELKKIKEALE